MTTLISIIVLLASILLVAVVFIQNPKGGGLSSDFGAAQQIGGVQKTNDFIDKTTWGLAAVIGLLSVLLTVQFSKDAPVKKKEDTQQTEGQADPSVGGGTAPVER